MEIDKYCKSYKNTFFLLASPSSSLRYSQIECLNRPEKTHGIETPYLAEELQPDHFCMLQRHHAASKDSQNLQPSN